MIKLALTGSIAMGKSTVASMFGSLGVPVYDSDEWTHKALSSKSSVFKTILDRFPDSWDKKTHSINRQKLGQIVFSSDKDREDLENIIHPYIWKTQDVFSHKHQNNGADIILFDIPLLFETGSETKYDAIIVVTAPEYLQDKRALARPNMTKEKLQSIKDRQWPDHLKREHADFIVHTGLGRAHSMRQVKEILNTLKNNERCRNA